MFMSEPPRPLTLARHRELKSSEFDWKITGVLPILAYLISTHAYAYAYAHY